MTEQYSTVHVQFPATVNWLTMMTTFSIQWNVLFDNQSSGDGYLCVGRRWAMNEDSEERFRM